MNRYIQIAIVSLVVALNSCKAIDVMLPSGDTIQQASLASIVVENTVAHKLETKGNVVTTKDIRVALRQASFTKRLFNSYEKALYPKIAPLKYIDSIDVKPMYVVIELIDDIAFIEQLKKEKNASQYAFAKANKKTRVVTEIALILDKEKIDVNANYFLRVTEQGSQLISYKNGKQQTVIEMSDTTIFDYKLSYAAWGVNNREQITLVDLVKEGMSCPSGLKRNPKKIIKETRLF